MAQAMLKRKGLMGEKAEDDSSCDDFKKYLNVDLLATIYPLNNSCTKKIVVSLHYNEETKNFTPLVQLLNSQYTLGLQVSRATWTELQNHFHDIEEYFNAQDCRRSSVLDTVKLDDVEILFTTSFGIRSIVFDKTKTLSGGNSGKRRKSCPPSIVMQKRTFHGLKRAVTCVDERFFRLDRIVALVNKCKEFIKKEVSLALGKLTLKKQDADATVRDILKERATLIQDKLKEKFNASTDRIFLEHYFDIVYLELITMYYDVFSHELLNESIEKDGNAEKLVSNIM